MIIVVMGVSGVGKTTIGTLLAQQLNIPFYDGDDFHPEANIAKMQHGVPLTDSDRRLWLHTLHDLIQQLAEAQQSAVIACSALKNSYRQILAEGSEDVRFVFLHGSYDLIQQRLQQRRQHFMSASLLQSQFEALEAPADVLTVEITDTPEAIATTIRNQLT
ncbi:MAG: gluconokinase [Oscillatoriales cyanobacterium C42_A2020_001]|nr:gluconokinase [Leptolyngbyaceae cyanobacterium C42_A2020_001]